MDVCIDQTRGDDEPFAADRLFWRVDSLKVICFANGNNPSVANSDRPIADDVAPLVHGD
jgi:hypothetical protein